MKKILIWSICSILLGVAALILVPAFINWSSYKHVFEQQLASYLKLETSFSGGIKLRLLPTPALAIKGIHVKAPAQCKEGDFISIESAEAHLSLIPLIQGKIDISSINLHTPHLTIDQGPACFYPFMQKTEGNTPKPEAPGVKLSALIIDNGEFNLTRGPLNSLSLKNLSFNADFDDLFGPYSISGKGTVAQKDMHFNIDMNQLREQKAPFKLGLNIAEDQIVIDGMAHFDGATPTFTGNMNINMSHKKGLGSDFIKGLPAIYHHPIRLSGQIAGTKDQLDVTSAILDWGQIHAGSQAKILFTEQTKIDATLDLQALVLDPFLELKKSTGQADLLGLPNNLEINLTCNAASVTYASSVLSNNQVTLSFSKGQFILRQMNVALPFNGRAAGDLAFNAQGAYQGHVQVDMPDLKSFLRSKNIEAPPEVLNNMMLKATVLMDGEHLFLQDLDAHLDQSNLNGDITINLQNYGTVAQLAADQLKLDPYLLVKSKTASTLPNLKFALNCPNFNFKKYAIGQMKASGHLHDAQLDLDQFDGNIKEIAITGKGQFTNLTTDVYIHIEGNAKGNRENVGEIQASFNLTGNQQQLTGNTDFFAYGAQGTFQGNFNPTDPLANLNGTLKIKHPEAGFLIGDRDNMGPLELETQITSQLRLFACNYISGTVNKEPLSGRLNIDFNAPRPLVNAELNMGIFRFANTKSEPAFVLASTKNPPKGFSETPFKLDFWNSFDGHINLNTRTFMLGDVPLNNFFATIQINNGQIKSDNFTANLFGGQVSGRVSFIALTPAQLTTNLRIVDMDPASAISYFGGTPKLYGRIDADLNFQGTGDSPFSLMSTLIGSGRVNLDRGLLKGADLNRLQQELNNFDHVVDIVSLLRSIKSEGETPLYNTTANFTIKNGEAFTNDLVVACKAGRGVMKGVVNIPYKTLDLGMNFDIAGKPEIPSIEVDFFGPWSQPETEINTDKLKAYLLGQGLKSIGTKDTKKEIIGALIDNVLPKSEPTQGKNINVPEVVSGLINGLIQKK